MKFGIFLNFFIFSTVFEVERLTLLKSNNWVMMYFVCVVGTTGISKANDKTVPGYVSFRFPESGTLFTQARNRETSVTLVQKLNWYSLVVSF